MREAAKRVAPVRTTEEEETMAAEEAPASPLLLPLLLELPLEVELPLAEPAWLLLARKLELMQLSLQAAKALASAVLHPATQVLVVLAWLSLGLGTPAQMARQLVSASAHWRCWTHFWKSVRVVFWVGVLGVWAETEMAIKAPMRRVRVEDCIVQGEEEEYGEVVMNKVTGIRG